MGFKRKNSFTLDFDGTEFEGLVVVCRPPSIAALAHGAAMQGVEVTAEEFKTMLGYFAEGLVSWNYEDDNDQPIPATREELLKVDQEMGVAIVDAWMTAVTGVSAPLGESSPGGDPSVEALLPMEPLSASQAS